ncbi:MAG: RES family NAD+ phosphorylase [Rhizobiaceae bacterium]
MTLDHGRYRGFLYRALNTVYARTPLSGRGAAIHGGRFNPKGRETLYTSLAAETALREANQVGTLQPTTLVAYRADIGPVLDGRDDDALAQYGLDRAALGAPDWRIRMLTNQTVPTQNLAERLIADGYAGLLVSSFARGATDRSLNLVLWRWNTRAHDRLELIDDEGRLSD